MSEVIIKELNNAKLLVLSEKGENHIKSGICNQDSYSFKVDDSGNYAFVVADGVSTCAFAKEGADKACEAVCNLLSECMKLPEDDIKQKVFSEWKNLVEKNWNDYGTTINFIYVYPERIVMGKVGDGAVIVKDAETASFLYEESEFYTSETFALGTFLPKQSFKVNLIKRNNSLSLLLVLMTDGIEKELDSEKLREFSEYIDLNIGNPNFVLELKDWGLGLNKKNGDDKTILICKIEGR